MKITKTKRIRYDDSCNDNPIYLSWINTLGGRCHWLFSLNQFISFGTGEETIFEMPVSDLENSEAFQEVLSLQAGKGMIVGCNNIDRNDIEFVKSILYSTKVQILENPLTWTTEGCKWTTVIPVRGTFPLIETKEERADISVTLKFPMIQIQQQ